MLTASQKATILRKNGIDVPPFPGPHLPNQGDHPITGAVGPHAQQATDADERESIQLWTTTVHVLYASYAAARAAKSLRDAEEAGSLARLRQQNSRPDANSNDGVYPARGQRPPSADRDKQLR